MLHKISDFVKRVAVMHDEAQRLQKMKYDKPKATQVERICAAAKKHGGETAANQKRFFSVAIEHGQTMEPAERLAGLSR